jgi:NADH:ubiquinone oxidoreductase subunit 4 (subunit M)
VLVESLPRFDYNRTALWAASVLAFAFAFSIKVPLWPFHLAA